MTSHMKCEEQYRILFEGNPHPIWIYDLGTFSFLAVNDAAIHHYGYSREEFLAMTIKDIHPPEDIPRLLDRISNTKDGLNTSGIWRHRRKDGTVIDVEITSHALIFTGRRARLVMVDDITERKWAEKMILHLAYYDILTGLPNRALFHDLFQRAIHAAKSKNSTLALIIIDLNRFNEINNTLGHHNGDLLLQQVGQRLQDTLREADLIARLDGDEFVVLMSNTDANDATQTVNRIIKRLEETFVFEEIPLDISASIGIALFPDHGNDTHTLTRRADIAMHMAKKVETGWALYSPEFNQYSPARLQLMGELRHAIEEDQLFLLYQPKVDLRANRIIGVEALVRWQHPRLGVIPPNEFISLAEHTGLIKQLTFWVLKEALHQSRDWNQVGLEISVAINLSVRNLQTSQLLDQIKGLLSTCDAVSNSIRFEITESIIMADPERTMEVIKQLTALGIRFSIDDFGTGYSSLGYLQRLPVDEIKIDKSFVMDMLSDENSIKIVRSIIDLSHSLGLKVTAEGVENKEILNKLASLGCDAAQGYFISRPIPASILTQRLRESPYGQAWPISSMEVNVCQR